MGQCKTAHEENHDGKWKDLNLMDQENPESIKEQYKELGRIVYSGYKTADLEQDGSKLTHLTKFQ